MRRTPSIYWLLIGLSFLVFLLSLIHRSPDEPSLPWQWPHEVVARAVDMARHPITPLNPTNRYVVR